MKPCVWRGHIPGTRAASSKCMWHPTPCHSWDSHAQYQAQNMGAFLAFCHVPFSSSSFKCRYLFQYERPFPHLSFLAVVELIMDVINSDCFSAFPSGKHTGHHSSTDVRHSCSLNRWKRTGTCNNWFTWVSKSRKQEKVLKITNRKCEREGFTSFWM